MNLIFGQQKALEQYTKEQWQKWYAHKSNKESWIEAKEAGEEAEIDEGGGVIKVGNIK